MNIVLNCVFNQHDLPLVAAALILCFLTGGTGWVIMTRARAATSAQSRRFWALTAGTVTGAGAWATHFVAMLAYSPILPLAFDPTLTFLSAAIALAGCSLGAALAFGRLGGAVGGIIIGLSICAMHYTGMAAIRMAAVATWVPALIVPSVLIGVSFGGLSGWFAVRAVRPLNGLGAVISFVLAILSIHFAGMAAVRFVPDPGVVVGGALLHPLVLAVTVTACFGFAVALALVLALTDWHLAGRVRGEEARLRTHIVEMERTQGVLEKTSSELTAALAQAEAASNAKSVFLASMSHELRTPLNAVIGFSDTMLMEPFGRLGSPRYREYLADIRDSGEHLLSLINDILDLSRLDAGFGDLHEETFDLKERVDDVLRMVHDQAARAQVRLSTQIASGLPWLKADRRRFHQILLNLLSNALKFTPPGGDVCVSAGLDKGGGLVLRVADSGIGIASEDFARVLEPFGQVDSHLTRKHHGTGLGLPLSRQLVELHGGTLTLESQVGQGATITIRLPARRLVARASARTAAA
jgi:signal transduction histidine kinase